MEKKLTTSEIAKRYSDDIEATKFLESVRWANGIVCPHCKSVNQAMYLEPRNGGRKNRNGKVTNRRLWMCLNKECGKQFSVLVGTVFEDSHIPLSKWLLGFHEMCAAKNGVSAMELSRKLGITYKSAWHMGHRIRYALSKSPNAEKLGGVVEVDETYVGGRATNMHKDKRDELRRQAVGIQGGKGKTPVVTIVERGGEARSQVMRDINMNTIEPPIRANVDTNAVLNTDTSTIYNQVTTSFAVHEQVDHKSGEYVRGGKDGAHINSVEGYFGQLKPSLRGTYRHVSQKHLPRYLYEFDYRYSTRKNQDGERTVRAIEQTQGKRLMYQDLIGNKIGR